MGIKLFSVVFTGEMRDATLRLPCARSLLRCVVGGCNPPGVQGGSLMKTISSLLRSSKGEGVVNPIMIAVRIKENAPIIAPGFCG